MSNKSSGKRTTTVWSLRGVNGSVFDLSRGRDVQLSGSGLTGVGDYAPASVRTRRSATSYGQSRGPSRYDASAGSLTVTMNPDDLSRASLSDISRRWWSAWSYDEPARLTALIPGGWEPVSIDLYLDGEQPVDDDLDPELIGSFETSLRVVADDPLWRGPLRELIRVRKAGRRPFFPGPPFHLTTSFARGRRQVQNIGLLPMWPVWTIVGPATAWKIVAGGETLTGPIVNEGETLIIDTRPGRKSAKLTDIDGVVTNVTGTLTSWGFGSIPPGESNIHVDFIGSGMISAEAETLYPRRW